MASFEEHCKDCENELGDRHEKVNRWLDELFARLGFSVKHRDARHHRDGIEEVRRMWGDDAARAAEIHVSRDFHGWIPKNSQEVQDWRMGVVHTPPGFEWNDGMLVMAKKDKH